MTKSYGYMWALACLLVGCASQPTTMENTTAADAAEVVAAEASVSEAAVSAEGAVENVKACPKKAADDALRHAQANADVMIFESWPEETTLDNDHIADVIPVWLEAIDGAKETIDFSHYYAITAPDTALEKVIASLKAALERGVKVRFLIDKRMNSDANAELPQVLSGLSGLELREIDYPAITGGGVQHSKYFIVDGKTAYFGSQNFDWRSLEQISEMGARLRPEALVTPLKQIFEMDWALALNPETPLAQSATCQHAADVDYKGESMHVEFVASPQKTLPCADMWDLPKMIALIGQAKTSVSVQLLNYATMNYDKTTFMELDDALVAAAKRGVKVRLLVSDWSTKPKNMKDLKRLAAIENFEARMIEVPEHSTGFVPYSRTIHSKFMVVDDADTWLGTSNWGGDYFYKSRNVGFLAHGKTLNAELSKSFDHYWNSQYAIVVDPNVDYPVKNQAKKP